MSAAAATKNSLLLLFYFFFRSPWPPVFRMRLAWLRNQNSDFVNGVLLGRTDEGGSELVCCTLSWSISPRSSSASSQRGREGSELRHVSSPRPVRVPARLQAPRISCCLSLFLLFFLLAGLFVCLSVCFLSCSSFFSSLSNTPASFRSILYLTKRRIKSDSSNYT